MDHPFGSHDPPRTLAERLARLNDSLQALGERLKASLAGLVGDTVADAVRDAVRGLLGSREPPAEPYGDRRDHHAPGYYREMSDDPWGDEDRRWEEGEVYAPARRSPVTANRWRNAVSAALQAALWFIRRQPRRRPLLTTLGVTLAAGVTAFVAGPLFAAGAGLLASAAGLIFTADACKSAAALAAG